MRTINKMPDMATYRSAVFSGLPTPSVTKIESTGETLVRGDFLTKDEAAPGDVVCFHEDTGEMVIVSSDAFSRGGLDPKLVEEAIVVVPASHMSDGRVRCCPMRPMVNEYGNGFSAQFVMDREFWGAPIPRYIPVHEGTVVSESSTLLYLDNGYAPFDVRSNDSNSVLSIDGYTRYFVGWPDKMIPSVYNSNFNRFQSVFAPHVVDDVNRNVVKNTNNIGDANSSYEAFSNLKDDYGVYDAIWVVYNFDSGHIGRQHTATSFGWYIPSIAELLYFAAFYSSITKNMTSKFNPGQGELPPVISNDYGYEDNNTEMPKVWALNLSDGHVAMLTIMSTTEANVPRVFSLLPFTKI